MKNLLRKLARVERHDRREELEHEAAERIREAGGQAPPEAYASSWSSAAPPAPAPSTAAPAATPSGRRLTVQERLAARELQNR